MPKPIWEIRCRSLLEGQAVSWYKAVNDIMVRNSLTDVKVSKISAGFYLVFEDENDKRWSVIKT